MRRLLPLLLAVSFALPLRSAAAASEGDNASQAAFVQQVLRTPLERLSQEQINRFLYRVAPRNLPAQAQQAYFQKRDSIMAAGLHRSFQMDEEPEPRKPSKPAAKENSAKALLAAGYKEIDSAELAWLNKQTKCSTAQLEEHSTLKIVVEMGRDKKKTLRYFLHSTDPFFAAVANYRTGRKDIRGTRLFGTKGRSYCGNK
ncbi:MAG: hypothetical protein HY922_01690 [Elusimicrobia bacterium]|nr:hypothetical protein [Elusimicrobiota bacterium]